MRHDVSLGIRSPRPFRFSSLLPGTLHGLTAILLLLVLAACGGGGADFVFDEPFPEPEQPGEQPPPQPTPPPAPPQAPVWDPDAAVHGRTALFGAFPSDLVRHGDTLFVVDADAIELTGARILAYDVSGPAPVPSTRFATTTLRGADLLDSTGQAGDPTAPIGFGFFLDDVLVVNDRLAFVLVNAGGSDSSPTLSNVVAFDPTAGTILQTLDLAQVHVGAAGTLRDSTGLPVPGDRFVQSGAEGMAYAAETGGTGRLFVAMSNLVFGAPSNGSTKLPGTIQVLDVDLTSTTPLSFAPGPGDRPFVFTTQAYNPVAVRSVRVPRENGGAFHRLIVTVAGTTAFDANFNLVPVTDAAVEVYDASNGELEGTFRLGLAGLSAVRPALGTDAAGHQVGFFPSSVTGEVYLLRLDGLYTEDLDASRLAVLRGPLNGIPITAAQAGGPGGNVTGVALSPDGRTLVVTGFGDLFAFPNAIPGQLFLLSLPEDVVSGAGFGTDFVPGSTLFAATPGRTLGGLVLVPGDGSSPDVYVNVSGTLDANFLGNGSASLGSLQTHGLIR